MGRWFTALRGNPHYADKVSVLGFKFEISEALRNAELRREVAERTTMGLVENIQELQELDQQLNSLVRAPSDERFFDFLDAVTQAAAFTVRPSSRAVRVSIWLYSKQQTTMRIIASYRVSLQTRETFEMGKDGASGFAAQVLRESRIIVKNEAFSEDGGDWKVDRSETHGTASIMGIPVQIDHSDWDAVLCFSTERKEDAFNQAGDRAATNYFATVASTLLNLALSSQSEGHTSMVEEFWKRYRRS